MTKLFSALAFVSALFLFATGAQAGGSLKDTLPLAEAGRCVGGAFSGAYVGAQIGGGNLTSHQHAPSNIGTLGFSDDDSAFTIGIHDGYNVQCGRVLFGIESDFNYFEADTSSTLDESCCGGGGFATFRSGIDWFGTLRGRIGLVHNDNLLIFATAGLAYSDVEHSFADTGAPGGPFSKSTSDIEFGWTAGGGVEFLRDGPWSLRADALYVDLGSDDRTYTVGSDCDGPCSAKVNWDDTFWVARVGFTYHIGVREPEPIVPLK